MRAVLDSQTRRRVDLIEYLSTVDFASTETLMRVSNTSDKTIISDLNFIEKHWGNDLKMQKYRDVYYFEMRNVAMIHQVFRELFSKSLPIAFIFSLFKKPHEKMRVHAKAFNV